VVFNLADFRNLPNRQNKFYAKFSPYMVCTYVRDVNIANLTDNSISAEILVLKISKILED